MLPIDDTPLCRDGNALILAYDHGLEHGPSDFRDSPQTTNPDYIFELARHDAVTALAVQKGVAEMLPPDFQEDTALIVKCNGTSNMWEGEPYSPKTCSVAYAAEELDADAIGYTLYPGSDTETQMVKEFRDVQEAARDYGLPVIVWAYPRGNGVDDDTAPETISYGARIAVEHGADMVKLKWPGSTNAMEDVVDVAAGAKVVLSGGSKDESFLDTVEDCMDAGCSGVAVGRNVWQRQDPETMLEQLQKIIYR